MFEILIACLLGVLCGAVTGIIPGVHVNSIE
jgi:putative membrane protein